MSKIETTAEKRSYKIEIAVLLLFMCALAVIMYFHEPSEDEAQAWMIARGASITELLGGITHYEGHPPIWYFILMPFAKGGVPFEIGIKAVNFIIVSLAMGILIFKAPFNRIFRYTIPFTYFFFYQYGVISRPYGLMMLGFVLSALKYREKNEKPFRFVGALSIICGSSAYGMIIAAGISLVWLWEMIGFPFTLDKIKQFLKSRRFYALMGLLVFNILLLLCIYPVPDAYAVNTFKNPRGTMLSYLFLMAPADATCGFGYYGSVLQKLSCLIISIFINILLLNLTGIFKKRALFILPYTLFAVFAGMIYFWFYHIGIIAAFYVFLLWCCFDKSEDDDTEAVKINQYGWVYYAGYLFTAIVIGISLYWSIAASINDISLNYGNGREVSDFIIKNKLDQKNILVSWAEITDKNTGKSYQDYNITSGLPALAYFDKNIFYNFNKKADNKCYVSTKINTDGTYVKNLIKNEYPDVLIKEDFPEDTFGSEINMDDFVLVKTFPINYMWKSIVIKNNLFILIRKDLLKNYPNLAPMNQ